MKLLASMAFYAMLAMGLGTIEEKQKELIHSLTKAS
jgi:hypothetical protein